MDRLARLLLNGQTSLFLGAGVSVGVAAGGFDLAQGAAVEIKCEGFAPCP